MPPSPQRYNDFRGWPVSPQHEQPPVRGTFRPARPDPDLGPIHHTGVGVAVRDDRPEGDAAAGRTHRVFAIEGVVVEEATQPGVRGNVRVGHFRYGHVDVRVRRGERVRAGQLIGDIALQVPATQPRSTTRPGRSRTTLPSLRSTGGS